MSQLLNDQNKFDHVVKHKPYRINFLKKFGEGWEVAQSGNLNSFHKRDRVKHLEEIIKQDLNIIEQDEQKLWQFAHFLGLLVGTFRYKGKGTHPTGDPTNVIFCRNEILAIQPILGTGYWDYYKAGKL